jgi:MFS family permease
MFKNLFNSKDFPRSFWVLMGATLIDQIGRFALIPFFGLYITSHFGISMTRLGELFFIWAIFGILGSFLSGAIIDKIGRKTMIVSGLVFSAGTSLFLGFADNIAIVFALAAFVGLLSDIGGPAQQAMVADMLPPERHADGFGIWRVVVNVAAVIGPLLAGLLVFVTQSYLLLFILDAVLSLVTALVVFFFIAETKPKSSGSKKAESFGSVLFGYWRVLADLPFMAFVLISILSVITYSQMNTTMPVYMRDVGGIPPSGYSMLLALNAFMVVTLQLAVTRGVQRFAPMQLLAVGVFLYAIGFGLFGFTNSLTVLAVAMVIITFGELIAAPVAQTVAARFAPADMRGRYLAMFGFSWSLPIAIGPYMAGWVWDNVAPPWIWYGALALGVIGALGYSLLHIVVGKRMGTLAQKT